MEAKTGAAEKPESKTTKSGTPVRRETDPESAMKGDRPTASFALCLVSCSSCHLLSDLTSCRVSCCCMIASEGNVFCFPLWTNQSGEGGISLPGSVHCGCVKPRERTLFISMTNTSF